MIASILDPLLLWPALKDNIFYSYKLPAIREDNAGEKMALSGGVGEQIEEGSWKALRPQALIHNNFYLIHKRKIK